MTAWTEEHRRLHGQTLHATLLLAHHACRMAADEFARHHLPMVISMQCQGIGLRAMAQTLNANGFTARQGGPWTEQTVRQLLKRRHSLLITELFEEQPQQMIGSCAARLDHDLSPD